eukprot:3712483-Amphidinium_carterae.3
MSSHWFALHLGGEPCDARLAGHKSLCLQVVLRKSVSMLAWPTSYFPARVFQARDRSAALHAPKTRFVMAVSEEVSILLIAIHRASSGEDGWKSGGRSSHGRVKRWRLVRARRRSQRRIRSRGNVRWTWCGRLICAMGDVLTCTPSSDVFLPYPD